MNKYKEHSKVNQFDLDKSIHKAGSSACSRKRAFETHESATEFIERRGYQLKIYKCKICYQFHTASIKKEQ